ncbi:MAG: hypothetical protein ACHBN1_11825 [Heteroscytonema crispum UTEX LB 1556]
MRGVSPIPTCPVQAYPVPNVDARWDARVLEGRFASRLLRKTLFEVCSGLRRSNFSVQRWLTLTQRDSPGSLANRNANYKSNPATYN